MTPVRPPLRSPPRKKEPEGRWNLDRESTSPASTFPSLGPCARARRPAPTRERLQHPPYGLDSTFDTGPLPPPDPSSRAIAFSTASSGFPRLGQHSHEDPLASQTKRLCQVRRLRHSPTQTGPNCKDSLPNHGAPSPVPPPGQGALTPPPPSLWVRCGVYSSRWNEVLGSEFWAERDAPVPARMASCSGCSRWRKGGSRSARAPVCSYLIYKGSSKPGSGDL